MTFWKIFTTAFLLLNVACSASNPVKETSAPKKDTFESWNRDVLSFNEDLDAAILKPVAKAYVSVAPTSVTKGITNFFNNIDDIGVTVNDLLQFKMTQSGMDISRFVVNTTAGGLGFFDVADMIDLPKHNEDFGQTLGFWGVPAGDFFMLPFVGSSSPREVVGLLGDTLLNPFSYTFLFGGGIAVTAATTGVNALDATNTRANLMGTEKLVNEAATDRYQFIKNAYQQRREYLVHDGNVPNEDDIDLLDEEELSTPAPTPKTSPTKSNSPAAKLPQLPKSKTGGLPPVINNSHRFLELSAPK